MNDSVGIVDFGKGRQVSVMLFADPIVIPLTQFTGMVVDWHFLNEGWIWTLFDSPIALLNVDHLINLGQRYLSNHMGVNHFAVGFYGYIAYLFDI